MRCVRCKASDGGIWLCLECRKELRETRRDLAALRQMFAEGCQRLRMGDYASAARALQKLTRRDEKHLGAYENLVLAYGFLGQFERAADCLGAMHAIAAPAVPPPPSPMATAPTVEANPSVAPLGRGSPPAPAPEGAPSPPLVAPPAGATEPAPVRRRASRRGSRWNILPAPPPPPELSTPPLLPPDGSEDGVDLAMDHVCLGLFYRQMHEPDLAVAVLLKTLRRSPGLAEANLVLGSVYRMKGRVRLAVRHLKAALGDGECAAADYELGLCHELLGQLKKAHTLVSRAVVLEPDNPHMHLSLGMLYEKLGRPRLAGREYRVASSLNSAFAPALVDISFRLGLQAVEEGELERALHEFQIALAENPQLFSPVLLAEVEQLLVRIIRQEQIEDFLSEHPPLRQLPVDVLHVVEETFGIGARLGFLVGLAYYWDGSYDVGGDGQEELYGPAEASENWEYEPVEPEATWLEGSGPHGRCLRGASVSPWRGHRHPPPVPEDEQAIDEECLDGIDESRVADEVAAVRAEVTRAEAVLGLPPLPFEFIFEEWLNAHVHLASRRVAERPLVSPDTYQRLLALAAACVRRVQYAMGKAARRTRQLEGLDAVDSETLFTALWATIIESYLLRLALERCRSYSRDFMVRLGTAERYRRRRLFGRAIRELEAALQIMPENASVHNFLWNLYIREARFTEAIAHCHAVLRFTPHELYQAAAYNDLAYCMVESEGDLNLAARYTEKARALAPHLFDAHVNDTVAWLKWRQGRYDEALQLAERVIAAGRDPDHPLEPTSIHFYHYGHILRSLGREADAQEAFARALEMEVDAESDWGVARRLRADRGER